MGINFKKVFNRKRKSLYKVECHLTIKDTPPKKVEIQTTAFTKKKAMQRIKDEVSFEVVKAFKVKQRK